MRFQKKYIGIFFLLAVLIATSAFVQSNDLYFQIKKQLTIFSDVYKEVATLYVDEVGPEVLMKKGIESMLEVLDPYTVFIDEGEQQQMEIFSSGSYGGIGIDAGFKDDQIVIIAPLDGYPAQRAGLRPGDVIVKINDVDVSGFSPEEVQNLTIGDVGSKIKITIKRPGIDNEMEYELTRERIEVQNVSVAERLGEQSNVLYVQLSRFGQQASEEIREILLEESNQQIDGLILDIRNNPGGLLNEAVDLIDKFVEPGITLVETRGRLSNQNNSFSSDEPALFKDLPIAVLINNGSASASEIVAGALQDLDRAVVIGEKSFGKGLVQIVRPLSYNTSLKITVSKYFIPSGRSIQSINYAGLDSRSGSVTADSLRNEFVTRNGRTVLDGKGIDPDIDITGPKSSLLEMSLLQNNYFFFFVNNYLVDHDEEMPDDLFEQFIQFLMDDDFSFVTPADHHIDGIEYNIENFGDRDAASENLDQLKTLLQDYKLSQLYESEEFIQRNLELEWISQTRGTTERNISSLNSDEYVLRAIEILKDSTTYQSILNP